MKAYTDLNQSKKLAEILPLESADMHFSRDFDGSWFVDFGEYTSVKIPKYVVNIEEHLLPCWSLAALLEIIRKPTAFDLLINGRGYRCHCTDKQEGKFYGTDDYCDTPIDACVEIIIKLYELKML